MARLRFALVFVSLLYVSSIPCLAQSGDRIFSETYAFAPGDMLSVATSSSDIILRAGSGSEARVEVYGKGRNVEDAFQRLGFTVERDGGALIVKTERDPSWKNSRASFDIVITAPERLDLNIATSSGDIEFRRVEGTGEIATSSGDVEFDTHAGSLSVSTSSGDVEADMVEGAFSFSTSSGDFSADAVRGASVSFSSSSGDFEADQVDTERFEASSSSGDITVGTLLGSAGISTSSGDVAFDAVEGALSVSTSSGDVEAMLGKPGPVEISTGSGGVTLRAPRSLAADIEVRAGSMRIDRAFAISGDIRRNSVYGQIGGGGDILKVSTGSGRFSLSAR